MSKLIRQCVCFYVLLIFLVKIRLGQSQGYGAKIAPPPAPAPVQPKYPPAHQEEKRPAVGGYGTLPPPTQNRYPPVPPPRRETKYGEGGKEGEKSTSSESGRERSAPSSFERPSPAGHSREKPSFESGRNRGGFESGKNGGRSQERYTPSNPSIAINIGGGGGGGGGGKEPMAPSFGPEISKPGGEGVQYDEKTGKAKLASFFGDSDARNRDRPLESSKNKKSNPKPVGIEDTPDETKIDCTVQPDDSTPKCDWKSEPQRHLNLWPSNMAFSICESLVKSPIVCQSMCEREAQCQSIHYCPNCIGHNCRLISEKQKGKGGLKLVQEFKFVDYYEKNRC